MLLSWSCEPTGSVVILIYDSLACTGKRVFELKLSRGADKAMGQILRYIGWLKQNFAEDKGVKGVIVAKNVDEKLKYAASIIPDLSLFEYELNFKIREVSI